MAVLPSFQERVPPLCLAAAANNVETYQLLISKGADPLLQKDALGRSPLHYAAATGAAGTCTDPLAKGLKPYQLDGQRNTPLHLAGEEPCMSIQGLIHAT